MKKDLMVFSGNANRGMALGICEHLQIPLSRLDISRFSNDNLFVQVRESVREKDVYIVQPFTQPVSDHIMELLIALDALRSASARRVTAVIPYFSYSRSDKKDAPRISITGRLMADLVKKAGANRVLTMDLHADAVHGFFSIPVDNLTAIPTISAHFQTVIDKKRTVAVATDAGGAKRVGIFAQRLGVPLAIIDKRRLDDTHVVQGVVVGDVANRDAIVFDDEISTAGTLVETVKTLKQGGARQIHVGVTHPVLCGPAVDNLNNLAIESLVVTNTTSVDDKEKKLDHLEVLSVAGIFAEAIRRIHEGESMGPLFR